MQILVTGGAGYIGSHAVLVLLQRGCDVVVLDNLSNGSMTAVRRAQGLAGREATIIEGDIRDRALLDRLFDEHTIDAVMHFAGLKAVGESVANPLRYYETNVGGSTTLLQAMAHARVERIIFSSSATVYGDEHAMPLHEDLPTGQPTNPYGQSKLIVEQILHDAAAANPALRVGILRYFNPVGAHESGRIGEAPQGWPNNLMPFVSQVAIGKRESLAIFGDDYPTPDGTGVRDYIHVTDLIEGHVAALQALEQFSGFNVWNLGTGTGYSVLDIVAAFEHEIDGPIPRHIEPRRDGDVAASWANPAKARRDLNWHAKLDLQTMVADAWRWQRANPDGYQ